jgi:CHASE1-domain containing sensor protein
MHRGVSPGPWPPGARPCRIAPDDNPPKARHSDAVAGGTGWRLAKLRPIPRVLLPLIAGALAFAGAALWERGEQALMAALRNADIASNLRMGLAMPAEVLYATQAFLNLERRQFLTLAEFRAFCAPAIARHPELAGLEWFPLVRDAERATFERWVQREQPGFEIREPTRAGDMVRAVQRAEHATLTFMEPFVATVQGLDLAFDPERMAPLRRALSEGRATVSDRFQLVEDAPGVMSVVAYAPATRVGWVDPAQTGGELFQRGVAVALFRISPLIRTALQPLSLDGLALEVWDPSAPESARLLYRSGAPAPGQVANESAVPFFDRNYRLAIYTQARGIGLMPVLACVLVLLLSAGALALADSQRNARRLARAAERLGQYQLEARIATGGMGTVYRAHHALLRRPTAIKIANEGRSAVSFEAEARLTSTLTHPNTVVVYDYGRGSDGSFYCAMEYIEGYDLHQLVERHGPLPAARVIRLLLQAAGSLQEAHERGMVHRDVKPSNIMVTERGGTTDFVKVLDFGLARAQLGPAASTEPSVAFAGTPGYAAPEVIGGGSATPVSDVFSLGAVGHFLLAGRGPFSTPGSSTESLTRTLSAPPDPLPETVPRAVEQLLAACLAKTPSERPPSMSALAERLRAVVGECPAWTRADADRWWREHPPESASAPVGSSSATFVPAGFGLTEAQSRRRSPG